MTEPGDAPPAGARRIEVAASFWSTPRERVAAEADRLARAGLQLVHWDHTDGDYAAAGGFTAVEAEAVTLRTGLFAEGHLMVRCPLREIDAWTGFCVRVAVHAGTIDWRAAVDRIRSRGIRAAVAVAGGEPVPEARRRRRRTRHVDHAGTGRQHVSARGPGDGCHAGDRAAQRRARRRRHPRHPPAGAAGRRHLARVGDRPDGRTRPGRVARGGSRRVTAGS